MLCSPPSPASVVIVETVPKVLLSSVPVGTSSLSFGHINTIAASLFVKDVLFVWESSFIVSGVLPVTSFPLPIGENSFIFASCSSAFGIGVDSVVFFSTLSSI